jgi:hypothetical protein
MLHPMCLLQASTPTECVSVSVWSWLCLLLPYVPTHTHTEGGSPARWNSTTIACCGCDELSSSCSCRPLTAFALLSVGKTGPACCGGGLQELKGVVAVLQLPLLAVLPAPRAAAAAGRVFSKHRVVSRVMLSSRRRGCCICERESEVRSAAAHAADCLSVACREVEFCGVKCPLLLLLVFCCCCCWLGGSCRVCSSFKTRQCDWIPLC